MDNAMIIVEALKKNGLCHTDIEMKVLWSMSDAIDMAMEQEQKLLQHGVSGKRPTCYKSNEPCKYNCSGLCKDSC